MAQEPSAFEAADGPRSAPPPRRGKWIALFVLGVGVAFAGGVATGLRIAPFGSVSGWWSGTTPSGSPAAEAPTATTATGVVDARADADVAQADPGIDAGEDAGADAGEDAGADAGADAGEDAGEDAGADAGEDAGADAGADAGELSDDAGTGEPGFLTVTSSSAGPTVYLNGKPVGRVGARYEVPCGKAVVQLGTHKPGIWLSLPQDVDIPCGGATKVFVALTRPRRGPAPKTGGPKPDGWSPGGI